MVFIVHAETKQTVLQDDAEETPGSAAAAALLHMKLLFWAIERYALGQLLKGGRGRLAALEVVRLTVVLRLRVQICAEQRRMRLSNGDPSKLVTMVRGLSSSRSSTATRLCTPRGRPEVRLRRAPHTFPLQVRSALEPYE